IRELGNIHRHTVQCALIINMFNEKIYSILYWWFLVVAIISIGSLIYWLATSIFGRKARHIIVNYLYKVDPHSANNTRRKILVQQFLDESLKADGVFLLRLIALNAGDAVACELVDLTWNDFKRRHAMDLRTTPPGSRRSRTPASLSGRSAIIDYSS
uniref:Innexin n=1 Tax=Plectus sambesii TaxID=2011161 RepID=A0A914UW99_9BILA